tara:strand:- start:19503 stop:20168 length:666 start_codon:yes stop_codon:yes gene_type:complete
MLTRLTLLFSLCFATIATAGAWPREKGTIFIAAGGNFLLSDGAQLPVHYDPTVYAEYGLSERVTIGLDLYTADAGRIGSAFFFTSFPLGDLEARDKFAANVAFGVRVDAENPSEMLLRAGLSWGRGLTNGWIAVDALATYGTNARTFRPKIDVTWGRRWSERWTTSLQLQTGQGFTNDYYAKVAPSIIYDLKDNIQVHLGAVHALTGDRGSGLKFETWLTF